VKDDRAASYQRTSPSLHRVRGRLVAERTALINQLRALMLERGIMPQERRKLERYLPEILADERNGLGPRLRRLIEDVRGEWRSIHQRIKGYNDELAERVHNEEAAKRLTRIPGTGGQTATALVAAVGNAQTFSCGRDLAAWSGLVPRQATTGGKPRLLRISKRGNGYLRVLLIHGRARLSPGLAKKDTPLGRWVKALLARDIATSCPWQTSWRGLLGRSLHVIAGMWLFKLRPVE
jgi:transposase